MGGKKESDPKRAESTYSSRVPNSDTVLFATTISELKLSRKAMLWLTAITRTWRLGSSSRVSPPSDLAMIRAPSASCGGTPAQSYADPDLDRGSTRILMDPFERDERGGDGRCGKRRVTRRKVRRSCLRARGLVQQHHWAIGQNPARHRQALPDAAAEPGAVDSRRCLQLERVLLNVVPQVDGLQHLLDHVVARRILHPQQQVAEDGIVEQERLLHHQRQRAIQVDLRQPDSRMQPLRRAWLVAVTAPAMRRCELTTGP